MNKTSKNLKNKRAKAQPPKSKETIKKKKKSNKKDQESSDSEFSDFLEAIEKKDVVEVVDEPQPAVKIIEKFEKLNSKDEAFNVLKEISENFTITIKHFKDRIEYQQEPLSLYSQFAIEEAMRKARYNISRKKGGNSEDKVTKYELRVGTKRKYFDGESESEMQVGNKRQKVDKGIVDQETLEQFETLARSLILNFDNQEYGLQKKMLDQISQLIQEDQNLFIKSIKDQANQIYEQALVLFKERNYMAIQDLFTLTSPMAVVMINIKITKKIPSLIDESNGLVITLLPYLSQCQNFDFIEESSKVICSRFVQSLAQYYLDTEKNVDRGFVLFGFEFNPQAIQQTIKNNEDKENLAYAFEKQGFDQHYSALMSKNHLKFLWPGLMNVINTQSLMDKRELIAILAKLKILQEPGPEVQKLISYFALRRKFIDCLILWPEIPLTIEQLINALDQIKGMNSESIFECLQKDPKEWIKSANVLANKEVSKKDTINEQKVLEIIKESTKDINDKQVFPFEKMKGISMEVQKACEYYQHNDYQCGIASIIASHQGQFKIIEMPTGSGKTWVQALLAKHYIKGGKKVTIVEPNETLRTQTAELLNDLEYDLQVITIDMFYKFPNEDQVIIVNEHDTIIEENPFQVVGSTLTGLWQLDNRQVIFFSATSNRGIEKIINDVLKRPLVLKFKSEFEIINNVSSLSQGEIKPCKSKDDIWNLMMVDVSQYYDNKPIIIFCQSEDTNHVAQLLQKKKFSKYLIGASQDNLKEIRSWKYGILILNPKEAIGVNTKFAIDSTVLITNEIETEPLYIQTQGRSSRARGLCHSIYYPVSQESKEQILKNMKNNHIKLILELQLLLKLVWKKRVNKQLITVIEDAQNVGDSIKETKDLEQLMGKGAYAQLTKGFSF